MTGLPVTDVQLAWPADAHDPRIVGLFDVIEQLHRRSGVGAMPEIVPQTSPTTRGHSSSLAQA